MNCSRCRRLLKNDPHLHCGGCYEELLQRANGIVRENNDLRKINNGLRGHNDNLMVGVTMTNPTSAERALQIVAWLKSEFGLSLANDLDQRTVEAAIVRQLDHHARKSIRDTLALVNDDPAAGRVNTPEEAAAWLAKNVRADLAAEVARLESVRQSLIVERNGEAAAAMKWKEEAVRLAEELRLANDFIRQQREKTLEELAAQAQALNMGY